MSSIRYLQVTVTMPGDATDQVLDEVRQAVVERLFEPEWLPHGADVDVDHEWEEDSDDENPDGPK